MNLKATIVRTHWDFVVTWDVVFTVLGRSAHDDGVFKSVPEYANLLRRLCVHHRCTFEMVREVIGNVERAKSFWYKLVDGDQCESQPCGKGTCLDAINSYTCLCSEGYTGENCQIDTQACSYNNGGCEHFCTDEPGGRTKCWCAPGYNLQANGACEPKEEFSCGLLRVNKSTQAESRQMFGPRIVRGKHCLPGHCPWQVLLAKRHNGQPFCGGALVNERWVLTADHCIRDGDHRSLMADYLILGDYNIFIQEEHEQKIPICQIIRFKPPLGAVRNDYDMALIELAHPANFSDYVLPICLPPPDSKHDGTPLLTPGGLSTISGWGQLDEDAVGSRILQMAEVPFVTDATCRQAYGAHAISRRMFCAGFANGAADACAGDSGGPHVTYRGSTAFLTGIVSWGRGCARVNRYGVYTRVNRMLGVIRTAMRKADASRRAGNHRCWTNVL